MFQVIRYAICRLLGEYVPLIQSTDILLQRGAEASQHARKVIGSTAFTHDLTELPGAPW